MTQENLNEEMNCQTSKARPLCSNNCSCCGSTATKNICYKCYEELPKHTEVPADGLLEVPAICSAPEVIIKSSHAEPDWESTKPSLLTSRVSNRNMAVVLAKTNSSRIQHRCFSCKKRVGLTGFRCRCGDVFCASHRYSDKHVCSFDYKVAGRDAIFKENPVIRAAKIQKI